MSATAIRTTATVRCPVCGDVREVSVRQRRRVEHSNGDFTCSVCRTLTGPVVVTQKMRDYWLERYPLEWIIDVADGIWGHP